MKRRVCDRCCRFESDDKPPHVTIESGEVHCMICFLNTVMFKDKHRSVLGAMQEPQVVELVRNNGGSMTIEEFEEFGTGHFVIQLLVDNGRLIPDEIKFLYTLVE